MNADFPLNTPSDDSLTRNGLRLQATLLDLLGRRPSALLIRSRVARAGGDIDRSLALCAQALQLRPHSAEVHLEFAIALLADGRAMEAIGVLDESEDCARVDLWRGTALLAVGHYAEALDAFERSRAAGGARDATLRPMLEDGLMRAYIALGRANDALAIEIPAKPSVRRYLLRAEALHALERHDEALDTIAAAIECDPNNLEARLMRGELLRAAGRFEAACDAYSELLDRDPDNLAAIRHMGSALRALGRTGEALQWFDAALELDSDDIDLLLELGTLYTDLGRYHEALRTLERAHALEPRNPALLTERGRAYYGLGRRREALAAFEETLHIDPSASTALYNRLELLERTNQLEAARAETDTALTARPQDPILRFRSAVIERRRGENAAALTAFRLIDDAELPTPDLRAQMHHHMGVLYDKLDDVPKAMDHFTVCNAHWQEIEGVDRLSYDAYPQLIDHFTQLCTREWLTSWTPPIPAPDRPAPVFLIGFPRSGTTLVSRMLIGHPAVTVLYERPTSSAVLDKMRSSNRTYPDALPGLDEETIAALRAHYWQEVERFCDPSGKRVVDAFTMHIEWLGLIARLFPDAKVIIALRHPCDVVLSCFMQTFTPDQATIHLGTLEAAARLYDKVMTLCARCQDTLPLQTYLIKYEDVLKDYEQSARQLLDFVDLPWDKGTLRYREAGSASAHSQLRKPGRWRHYAKYLEPVRPVLDPWLERFGYVCT